MVGPCVEVRTNAAGDRVARSPCNDVIDEAVAPAISKVVIVEAQPAKIVHVIGQLEIERQPFSRE